MDTENTEAGAETGNEHYFAQLEAEQATAESEGGDQSPAGAEAQPAGNVEPGAEAAEAQAADKPALPPLSVEEYQKRHQDITTALRTERHEKRQMRSELEQLRDTVQRMEQAQPQAFQRYTVEQQIAQYEGVDWQRWYGQDYAQADASNREYQALIQRKEQMDRADREAQAKQQQQNQQQQLQSLVSTLNEQEDAYRTVKPDYDDAVEHLRAELRKDANNQGWFGEQNEEAFITQQLVQIGSRVNAAGRDMAEFAYNLAVQRGYQAKAPAADITAQKAGEAAAKTLSNLGGKTASEGGSFEETMAGLNGAAARTFWEKAKKQAHV
jgi:hypothetical protein